MPETFVPQDDEQTLLQVTASANQELAELRELRAALADNPDDVERATHLAQRAIELGRKLDDPRLFGQAQAALASWWSQPEAPAAVAVLRATILQHRHEFAAALRDLNFVLSNNPANLQARLTRAVLHTVQGRYDDALEDCAIVGRRSRGLIGLACVATPASLNGAAERTYLLLGRIPENMPVDDTLVWALTIRAELAERLGRPDDEIERHYRSAVDATDDAPDRYLLDAFADWLLAVSRPSEALELAQVFESSDSSLLRAALARRQLAAEGDRRAAEQLRRDRAELAARFDAERARGGAVHLRESAIFSLYIEDDAEQSLWLARENFRKQREPLDARILLEAALAADSPEQARPVVDWYRASGVVDVRITAMIEAAEATLASQLNDGAQP